MTPEELDARLRTHTEHEEEYLQGIIGIPNMPRIKVGDLWIRRSVMEEMAARQVEISERTPGLSRSTDIIILRHGRFRNFPLHAHDFVEFTYMYDGSCTQVINDRMHHLRTGQVLLMDSNVIHTIAPLRENDILINICIDRAYLNSNFFNRLKAGNPVTDFFVNMASRVSSHDDFIIFWSENSRRLRVLMIELLCEWLDASPLDEAMIRSLFSCIITELTCVLESNAEHHPELQGNPVVPTLHYIEARYADCSLEEIAAQLYMSPTSLTRALKSQLGKTFRTLVQEQRMYEARRLLENTALPVTTIARRVGYNNVTFFYELFERSVGCSPGDYRASHLGLS